MKKELNMFKFLKIKLSENGLQEKTLLNINLKPDMNNKLNMLNKEELFKFHKQKLYKFLRLKLIILPNNRLNTFNKKKSLMFQLLYNNKH